MVGPRDGELAASAVHRLVLIDAAALHFDEAPSEVLSRIRHR
jgi:hypothetical protein